MTVRAPRVKSKGYPVLIIQRAIEGRAVFPTTDLYCHFLRQLDLAKMNRSCPTSAYGLTPFSIWVIMRPSDGKYEKVAQALFTSAAKKYRTHVRKGNGHVFARRFECRILKNEKQLKMAKTELVAEVRKRLGDSINAWPFVCVDPAKDVFGICDNSTVNFRDDRGGPPYLYSHGRPTLFWYLSVIDECRKAVDRLAKLIATPNNHRGGRRK